MAHFLLDIDGHQLFAIVVVSTLPTAQSVFMLTKPLSARNGLARDSAFVTTLASIPAIALVTALLA